MVHRLNKRFKEEIIAKSEDIEDVNLKSDELEEVLDGGVDIDHPMYRLEYITGNSLHNATRKEPITVHVDLQDVLKGSSSVVAGAAISNPYVSGFILLLIFTTIGLLDKQNITPYQALTYGVGWEMVGDRDTFIHKGDLIDEVIKESQEVDVVEDMDRGDVETALQQLDAMRCIEMKEADGTVLVWFREEFNVNYT
jgi:hypothetical protein